MLQAHVQLFIEVFTPNLYSFLGYSLTCRSVFVQKGKFMRKFLVTFAFFALLDVLFGSYFMPETPVLWLTNNDTVTQAVRLVLVVILGAQLVTKPPRALLLRSITMASALCALGFGVYTLNGVSSPIVDTLLFLQAGLALAITALETTADTIRTPRSGLVKA